LLAERAQFKKLELTGFVQPRVPDRVRGDAGRLRQILFNLIGNAIKFTPQGEVALLVHCAHESPGTVLLRFEIRDTGIGVATEVQPRLFQAFSQADASTTRAYGGTGLGLAICKQLAELMGGQIGIQSQIGCGSIFWFTARLEKCPDQPQAEQRQTRLTGQRVLLVDDNATSLNILHQWALAWNMRPTRAANAQEAMAALEAEADPFDVAVVDFQLPGVDGLHLARALRTTRLGARTRLILLTSFGQKLSPAQLAEAAIASCQTKPLKASSLYRALSNASAPLGTDPPARLSPELKSSAFSLRILVAEDNLINQRVTRGQLNKFGFTAEFVTNGRLAVDALKHNPYDVVLMDCQMPEMDGYEATRQIREMETREKRPPVRIIAMTARAMESDRAECLAAGMDDYVRKPVSELALRTALQSCPESRALPAPACF
jgi:two-component system sensor histidine kinase/response regulator